jgi:hypothetical protein
VSGALALLGTTLTAYAYVWETIGMHHKHVQTAQQGSS